MSDEALAVLRAVGEQEDEAIDVGTAALALGAFDRPQVPLDRYRDHLDLIAAEAERGLSGGSAADAAGRLAALNGAIVGELGYRGDTLTYDDPQNANLLRVIDRRKGLPVALGILYMAAAMRLGWSVVGLNVPGHFLARIDAGQDRVMFDPFNGGATVDVPQLRGLVKSSLGERAELDAEHYQAVGARDVLLRLQNNIKLRRLQARDAAGALAVVERMLLIAPGRAELMREAGLINAHLENLSAAIDWLERYVAAEPDQRARHRAATVIQDIKGRLN
jgi:regulator of sirC expression with transglutaminase-like and TPR domain